MKSQSESDKKCLKSAKIFAGALLMLSGMLLLLTWSCLFDRILFKVGRMNKKRKLYGKCCVIVAGNVNR